MARFAALFLMLFAFACGGGGSPPITPESGPVAATGLRLVMGVDRPKSVEVHDDGSVVSTQTSQAVLSFSGADLKLPDGSKTILTLDGTNLSGGGSHVGTIDGGILTFGEMRIGIQDDGVVKVERAGDRHTLRMHFEGSVAGKRRAALMLVAFFFALNIATHRDASFEQFVD